MSKAQMVFNAGLMSQKASGASEIPIQADIDIDKKKTNTYGMEVEKPVSLLNDLFDGIYCINLPSSRDRRIHMDAEFKTHKCHVHYIHAICPLDREFQDIKKKCADPSFKSRCYCLEKCGHIPRAMRECEIAITLSHLKAYQQIIENDDEISLIVEDDVLFHNDVSKIVQHLFANGLETILLSKQPVIVFCGGNNNPGLKINGVDKYNYHLTKDGFYSNYCCIINKAAANELIQYVFPISKPEDSYKRYLINKGLIQGYHIIPSLVGELSAGINVPSIYTRLSKKNTREEMRRTLEKSKKYKLEINDEWSYETKLSVAPAQIQSHLPTQISTPVQTPCKSFINVGLPSIKSQQLSAYTSDSDTSGSDLSELHHSIESRSYTSMLAKHKKVSKYLQEQEREKQQQLQLEQQKQQHRQQQEQHRQHRQQEQHQQHQQQEQHLQLEQEEQQHRRKLFKEQQHGEQAKEQHELEHPSPKQRKKQQQRREQQQQPEKETEQEAETEQIQKIYHNNKKEKGLTINRIEPEQNEIQLYSTAHHSNKAMKKDKRIKTKKNLALTSTSHAPIAENSFIHDIVSEGNNQEWAHIPYSLLNIGNTNHINNINENKDTYSESTLKRMLYKPMYKIEIDEANDDFRKKTTDEHTKKINLKI